MIPLPVQITIRRGDTKEISFRVRRWVLNELTGVLEPVEYRDLTGWTVLSQIRSTEDSTTVVAEFTPTIPDQSILANRGFVYLKLTPVQTEGIIIESGVWDAQLTDPGGDVYTYVAGPVVIAKDVSRDV